MKTIVFIGTQKSGSSRDAIRAAERLGYFTVLFTNKRTFIEKRSQFPDVHLMQLCDLNDIEKLRQAIKRLILKALEICAIVSFIDPLCYDASLLAEEFGVNHFSTNAIRNMQDKILSRQVLSHSQYSPAFTILSETSQLSKGEIEGLLPIIMKSPNSTGSKDVFKIETCEDFNDQAMTLFIKYPNESILIEEYLDGPQYLVEAIVFENKLHIVAIVEQEIALCNEHFIITGYNLLIDPHPEFYEKLKIAVEDIVKCHEIEAGPCHLEMRNIKNQWKLIEINPRISGAGMNKFIETGFGINLVEETIKFSLGLKPNLAPKHKKHTFAQYVLSSETGILEKVTGRNRASRCPGVKHVYIKPTKGTLIVEPISMGNRYAYIIATGESELEAKENAKFSASQIQFCLIKHAEE